jgi:isoamylase
VQYCVNEPGLAERGMHNYWGYNTLGFNCPDPRLSYANRNGGDPATVRREFRDMVDTLHANGLEVVLDVVYNHTPEGNEFGPTLSFRGLDNASYYRLVRDDKSRSENLTGCGNTLNVEHPRVTQFVLDSLRYWVTEMGVDGFRFDLAPVLGRRQHGFDVNAAFFVALCQDPVLAQVHLIAEPWDAGFDGYQVGRFPGRFLEWNDKFRDAVRGYWLGTGTVGRGELARRFTGSSDVFHHAQRRPTASINYICVHDGFTLADVTGYSQKHNLANGEDNRDGRDGELCANFGAEGPSDDPQIVETRRRVRRAMLATLLLAQGTPMLCAGDEIGNSQSGNNNAYCQDNELTWLDWGSADQGLADLVVELLALRRAEPLLRHNDWFHASSDTVGASIVWVAANGHEMHAHDWHDNGTLAFACLLRAETDVERTENKTGMESAGSTTSTGSTTSAQLLIAFNPEACDNILHLPERPEATWQIVFDSTGVSSTDMNNTGTSCTTPVLKQHAQLTLPARSVLVLRALPSALQPSALPQSVLH